MFPVVISRNLKYKMNEKEQEIMSATKEFARVNNIHFDDLTESMVLNAMREYSAELKQRLEYSKTKNVEWNRMYREKEGEVIDLTFNDLGNDIRLRDYKDKLEGANELLTQINHYFKIRGDDTFDAEIDNYLNQKE